jgi:hypothetical protein
MIIGGHRPEQRALQPRFAAQSARRGSTCYPSDMAPARKLETQSDVERRDAPLSKAARVALADGLASALADVATGRPLTPWGDFTQYAVEDDADDE